MRQFLFLSLLLGSLNLQARTEGRFSGVQYIIKFISVNLDATNDHFPTTVYEKMNVPEQQTVMGPGKVIEVDEKEMSFMCNKKGENSYHCIVLVRQSAHGSFGLRSAQVKYTGEKAKAMAAQFFPDEEGGSELHMTDPTGQFNLIVTPDLFHLTYETKTL